MNNKVEISLENGTIIEIDDHKKSKEGVGLVLGILISPIILILILSKIFLTADANEQKKLDKLIDNMTDEQKKVVKELLSDLKPILNKIIDCITKIHGYNEAFSKKHPGSYVAGEKQFNQNFKEFKQSLFRSVSILAVTKNKNKYKEQKESFNNDVMLEKIVEKGDGNLDSNLYSKLSKEYCKGSSTVFSSVFGSLNDTTETDGIVTGGSVNITGKYLKFNVSFSSSTGDDDYSVGTTIKLIFSKI